jgi:oligoendopeptidase F
MITTSYERKRFFLPYDFKSCNWADLKPWFDKLLQEKPGSAEELESWLLKRQELEAYIIQQYAEMHIAYTCNTNKKEIKEKFDAFIKEVLPQFDHYSHQFDKTFVESPFAKELPAFYDLYLKIVKNKIAIFNEKNLKLKTEHHLNSKKYSALKSNLSVDIDNKSLTIQQATKYLKSPDRKERKEAFQKISEQHLSQYKDLHELMDSLTGLRQQIAQNAGLNNYLEYRFKELNRFDYEIEDCSKFHESIRKEVKPLQEELHLHRKNLMGLKNLKPYDLECDPEGLQPLSPFENVDDLIHKTIRAFNQIHPEFGRFMKLMKEMGHFDLDSRKGKAPGGYNIFLPESCAPFIFMNSAGSTNDLKTMLHEGGHAVHSFYKSDINLIAYQQTPSEVSELAAMTMELISIDHYDEFFSNPDDIKRARLEQLERSINILPWIASVDEFQLWIYSHPGHTHQERIKAWQQIFSNNRSSVVDWSDFPEYHDALWQTQKHIFEYPLYYIEYGFAKLGAIAIWKNYKENPSRALEQFIDALKLGYTRPIPEIFQTAGIKFDFSPEYIRMLAGFVRAEMNKTITAAL